jgi:hypothetical protein
MTQHTLSTLLSGLKSWRQAKSPAIRSLEDAIKADLENQVCAYFEEKYQLKTSARVSQIECTDPSCPGFETIILIMNTHMKTQAFKIKKPLQDVTQTDIEIALGDFKTAMD